MFSTPNTLLLLVVIFSFVYVQNTLATEQEWNVPACFWSPDARFFNGKNTYSSRSFSQSELVQLVDNILHRNLKQDIPFDVLNQAEYDTLHPLETLVLFILPHVRTDEFSSHNDIFSTLKNTIEQSHSSVILPHTQRIGSPLTNDLLKTHPDAIRLSSTSSIVSFWDTEQGKTLLSNDQTDLVLIDLQSSSELQLVVAAIEEKTNYNCAFGFTGDAATSLALFSQTEAVSRRRRLEETTPVLVCPNGYLLSLVDPTKPYCFSHFVHMTPEIMVGILIGFLFLITTSIGLSCLASIQTPSRYSLQAPPLGKEF